MWSTRYSALIATTAALVACNVSSEGVDAGAAAAAGAGGGGAPEVYPADRTQSPLTPYVVDNLRAIAGAAPDAADDVFAKVGDSTSVSIMFMSCFAGDATDLGGRDELQDTIEFFRAGDAAGFDPYQRSSKAAEVGWSAADVLAGEPSGLAAELAAIDPRFAVILIGTNDIDDTDVYAYGTDLLAVADELIGAGVIPLLTSIMPRDDSSAASAPTGPIRARTARPTPSRVHSRPRGWRTGTTFAT